MNARDSFVMNSHELFEILVREHHAMLITYLRAVCGSATLADDLFQDTMVTAWNKLDSYDRSLPFGPWLRGIAKNHVYNAYRKHSREMLMCNDQLLDYLDAQFQYIDSRPGESWRDRVSALKSCLAKLSKSHREAINLRYLNEYSIPEVVSMLGISHEALKKRLQRAKAQLLDCLSSKKVINSDLESQEII